jgi:hypothetical protein
MKKIDTLDFLFLVIGAPSIWALVMMAKTLV